MEAMALRMRRESEATSFAATASGGEAISAIHAAKPVARGTRRVFASVLIGAGAFLTSCGSGQALNSPSTGRPLSTVASASSAVPLSAIAASQAFSRVNWNEVVLPGQSAIPEPPLMKAGCAMDPLGQIYQTSENKFVAYLSPSPGVNLAVLAASCSAYNTNAFTLFVYRATGTSRPTLLEVAYDGWFSTTSDLTSTVPTACASAKGWHAYFLYRSMRIIGGGQGFAVDGLTFGPKGPTIPLASAQMVPAEVSFTWNGSYLVLALVKNLARPTTGL